MKDTITMKTKLRAFLDERGVRYSWVADRLGISRPHFHFILEGERTLTPELSERLEELLGVPASTFTSEDTNG